MINSKKHAPVRWAPKGKRPRGSYPDQQLVQIRKHSPNVVCQFTGDSPREYLFKHGTTYTLQGDHDIPFKILRKYDEDAVSIRSPNGHIANENFRRDKLILTREDAKTCDVCGLNNFEYFKHTKFVVPFEEHHIDGNRNNNDPHNTTYLCPNCHYATSNHSVNKGTRPFRPHWPEFLDYLNHKRSFSFIMNRLQRDAWALQWNFYKTGLDLHYGTRIIPIPKCLRGILYIPNPHAKIFFNL